MVGEGVLLTALSSPDIDKVLVIGRRSCGHTHPKLTEVLHADFFDWTSLEPQLSGYNACFFCLGVSSLGKNEAVYTRLTYDLTMAAARTLSRVDPPMTFCYVSGLGTDSTESGRQMWARVKGRTENALTRLPFKAAFAFRPGMIRPLPQQRNLKKYQRWGMRLFPLIRRLAPNAAVTVEQIGNAMVNAAKSGYEKKVLENADIAALSRR